MLHNSIWGAWSFVWGAEIPKTLRWRIGLWTLWFVCINELNSRLNSDPACFAKIEETPVKWPWTAANLTVHQPFVERQSSSIMLCSLKCFSKKLTNVFNLPCPHNSVNFMQRRFFCFHGYLKFNRFFSEKWSFCLKRFYPHSDPSMVLVNLKFPHLLRLLTSQLPEFFWQRKLISSETFQDIGSSTTRLSHFIHTWVL